MKELVDEEEALRSFAAECPGALPDPGMLAQAKKDGFSDRYLATKILTGVTEEQVRARREELGIVEGWEGVHVSSTQDSAYYFSTYNAPDAAPASDNPNKIMILGGGPNRIGQGIEFDYCCVHAAKALKKLGFETIIVNCNPETVSTDYDTSDKLYFEPLTAEDVLAIYAKEKPLGVIAQFGGQTPLNLASQLERAGVRILGTSPEIIDLAEDRDRFRADMEALGIPMPEAGMAVDVEEALQVAPLHRLPGHGAPQLRAGRPRHGGRLRRREPAQLHGRCGGRHARSTHPHRPLPAPRAGVRGDAICDGVHAFVPAVMEHVELAGVHSGDSAAILPSVNITDEQLATIKEYTRRIATVERCVCTFAAS